ncbi:hypothetical protein [Deinococcus sedimenti]|uniref:Uncharacterized protein n=1 Tax=Deinococcus sedimenti TaxID=1867090 RepID=A0ABQ2RZ30_9DEIO|nr:hypothetical protein [Deinococcus sedimenti]GGR81325.1 hypothetical protein GCM10008960_05320 [Deinococcus sedimenti]
MPDQFRTAIADILPSAEAVRARLSVLSNRDRLSVAEFFSSVLSEVDMLVATPGAEALSHDLGELRGIPSVTLMRMAGHWTLVGRALHEPGAIQPARPQIHAAIISLELTSGEAELAASILGAQQGWVMAAVAAAVERTDAPGHVRLSLQGTRVFSPVVLAGTPRGLVFERRLPKSA